MTDKTREDFEAWLVKRWRGDRGGLERRADGEYLLGPVQLAWAATQQSAARIAALEAEVLALRKDAERYQWLRNEVKDWYVGPAYATYNDVVCKGKCLDLSAGGVALDSAIDAAIEAERSEG